VLLTSLLSVSIMRRTEVIRGIRLIKVPGYETPEIELKGDPTHNSFCVTHDLNTLAAGNDLLHTLHSAVRPRCDATQTGTGRKEKGCFLRKIVMLCTVIP
jgi:hypothetical protein